MRGLVVLGLLLSLTTRPAASEEILQSHRLDFSAPAAEGDAAWMQADALIGFLQDHEGRVVRLELTIVPSQDPMRRAYALRPIGPDGVAGDLRDCSISASGLIEHVVQPLAGPHPPSRAQPRADRDLDRRPHDLPGSGSLLLAAGLPRSGGDAPDRPGALCRADRRDPDGAGLPPDTGPLMRVYLAGPDVFSPDAAALAEAKRTICRAHGLEGLHPFDSGVDLGALPGPEAAARIYDGNLALMAEADLCIANLTPFRGPHVDDGTAFEIGWFAAQGKPVWGYDNGAASYRRKALRLRRKTDRSAIEDFGLPVNLMLALAVERSGGRIFSPPRPASADHLSAFAACVRAIADGPATAR